jgi:hypothetical protein
MPTWSSEWTIRLPVNPATLQRISAATRKRAVPPTLVEHNSKRPHTLDGYAPEPQDDELLPEVMPALRGGGSCLSCFSRSLSSPGNIATTIPSPAPRCTHYICSHCACRTTIGDDMRSEPKKELPKYGDDGQEPVLRLAATAQILNLQRAARRVIHNPVT